MIVLPGLNRGHHDRDRVWDSGFLFTAQIRSTTTVRLNNISFRASISVAFKPALGTGSSTTSLERLRRRADISRWPKSRRSFRILKRPGCIWISAADFNRILSIGLAENQPELPRLGEAIDAILPSGLAESTQAPFIFDLDRTRVTQLSSRVVRDRLFRRLILQAYDKRCAVTGLKLINGGGRAEVDAAHIRPVEASGPDILSNGIALSGTAHWMFDRGLIGLSDDLEVLVSRHANDRDSIQGLINRTGKAIVPAGIHERPHPQFLKWHRENTFKH